MIRQHRPYHPHREHHITISLAGGAVLLTTVACVVGLTLDGHSIKIELNILRDVAEIHQPTLTMIAKVLSTLGALVVLAPIAGLTGLWLTRRPDASSPDGYPAGRDWPSPTRCGAIASHQMTTQLMIDSWSVHDRLPGRAGTCSGLLPATPLLLLNGCANQVTWMCMSMPWSL